MVDLLTTAAETVEVTKKAEVVAAQIRVLVNRHISQLSHVSQLSLNQQQ